MKQKQNGLNKLNKQGMKQNGLNKYGMKQNGINN
jgi:hypothetical protein